MTNDKQDKIEEVKECSCTKEMECPEGQKWDAETEKCVPVEAKKEAEAPKKEEAPKESVPEWAKTLQTQYSSLSGLLEQLTKKESEIGVRKEIPKPTAQVSNAPNVEHLDLRTLSEKALKHIKEYGKFEFNIPYETLRSFGVKKQPTNTGILETFASNVEHKVTEEYSLSGTHATQDLDLDVLIVPGGNTFVPVRQFARTKFIKGDSDRARFFKQTLPATASQSPGTTATAASQTFTSVEVTPSTITGVYNAVDSDDIEDLGYDLVANIIAGQTIKILDYEATDMLDTVSKQGTLNPGLWIDGELGGTITHSDTAGITMEPLGIATAREHLENQGYLRTGVQPVCVIHPRQWKELVTSTNMTNYVQQGIPSITTKGIIEELLGVRLIVSNAVEHKDNTTTDAYNALCFVPNHSYGCGIKRDVNVKMHEVPEDNQIRVTTNWRSKFGVIDSTSIVRLSTTGPAV